MALEITKQTAKLIYPTVPDWFKTQLEEAFGKKCFRKRSFTDIETFEDALELTEGDLTGIRNDEDPDVIAYKKLKIIVAAINQGWVPDWNNTNQKKWFPYFNLSSGFGVSRASYFFVLASAGVGSRLCFESEEKARYAGNQFLNIYKDFLT